MRVLMVKMSSMGDVVHALPAVTDLVKSRPDVIIDWVVEEAFVDIPQAHPGVNRVIPASIRRWRKSWWQSRQEVSRFRQELNCQRYDVVVDAQGLIKSAVVARMANGPVAGLDGRSAREGYASWLYQRKFSVPRTTHAVQRQRLLMAGIFAYDLGALQLDYGVLTPEADSKQRIVFLHGTTWASKHWPEQHWIELAKIAAEAGYEVVLAHGNAVELQRAERIAAATSTTRVLPDCTLRQLMTEIGDSAGVVAVDTGLGHLAAALNVPLIGLYGATDPTLTGVHGSRQELIVSDHLPCIPCLKRICKFTESSDYAKIHPPCFQMATPEMVFEKLKIVMGRPR